MVIVEIPAVGGRLGRRVTTLGSCRLRNPIFALRDLGELRVCAAGMAATHTVGEALQSFEVVRGERTIPPALNPYVYETSKAPATDILAKTLATGVDGYLVEIADRRQFLLGDVALQQNLLSRHLIQPYRGALLPWFRNLTRGLEIDESCVTDTLDRLRDAGFPHDPDLLNILRSLQLTRLSRADIRSRLARLMTKGRAPWTVMGAITVPNHDGAIMADRRNLNADLADICEELGANFFDPTQLIQDHGRPAVLDSDGTNIFEFANNFYPVAGRAIIDAVGALGHANQKAMRAAGDLTALADRVGELLSGLHADRLTRLGEAGSGLFAHYRRRLEQHKLVGGRERAAASLIAFHLPQFGQYAVLRAGLGELALLIAATGRRVTAFEPNILRRQAIEAGRDLLESVGLITANALTIGDTLTPESPFDGETLCVALDASQVREEEAALPHMQRMERFNALLIDPRLFIRLREAQIDQDRLIDFLRSLNFGVQREYFADGLTWLTRAPTGLGPKGD